jgi:D-alanyl-D-alanine carboxypeptidase
MDGAAGDGRPEAHTDGDEPDVLADGPEERDADEAEGPSCEELRAVIGPSIEKAFPHMGSKDVAVGVRTDACESATYFAGPSGLDENMLFRIASVSKTYVAAAVLGLVSEGKLGLDETIEGYGFGLPNEDRITIRQLLNHTSGLYNYTSDPAFESGWTPEERLQSAASHDVHFEPGERWMYSNSNYVALGLIVLKELGSDSFAEVVRARILAPLGLESTYFEPEEPFDESLAPGFGKTGASASPLVAWADGGMVATLGDTTRWIQTFASGDATPALRDELLEGVPAAGGGVVSYGLGVMILSELATGDVPAYGHTGDTPGFHSLAFWFPERGYTIAVVLNQDGGDPNVPMIAVADALNTVLPVRAAP